MLFESLNDDDVSNNTKMDIDAEKDNNIVFSRVIDDFVGEIMMNLTIYMYIYVCCGICDMCYVNVYY